MQRQQDQQPQNQPHPQGRQHQFRDQRLPPNRQLCHHQKLRCLLKSRTPFQRLAQQLVGLTSEIWFIFLSGLNGLFCSFSNIGWDLKWGIFATRQYNWWDKRLVSKSSLSWNPLCSFIITWGLNRKWRNFNSAFWLLSSRRPSRWVSATTMMHSVDDYGDVSVSIFNSPDEDGVSTHQPGSSLPVDPLGGSLLPLRCILLTTVLMFQYSIHQMQMESLPINPAPLFPSTQ